MKRINSKNKGVTYELYVIKMMKALGYTDAGSTRNNNRALDALKVDLVNTPPFNIQAKAVESGINYHKLLNSMPDCGNDNIVFHKKNNQGTVVSMDESTFYHMVNLLKENDLI